MQWWMLAKSSDKLRGLVGLHSTKNLELATLSSSEKDNIVCTRSTMQWRMLGKRPPRANIVYSPALQGGNPVTTLCLKQHLPPGG